MIPISFDNKAIVVDKTNGISHNKDNVDDDDDEVDDDWWLRNGGNDL